MKKLLWIADAGCPSGFGRATHEILDVVSQHYDVTVLGLNYRGDPPVDQKTGFYYRYPMYAAAVAGPDGRYDTLGTGRLHWLCNRVRPDAIVVQNDGWFIPRYIAELRVRKRTGEYVFPQHAALPLVASVAIDGKNFYGGWLKDVTLASFWTKFALDEARRGGYAGPATVIPLGVDLGTFYPVERQGALERRSAVGLKDQFVVGNVNRNQPRKRWDLTIKYFAQWVHSHNVNDASLFFHSAPTGDESFDLIQLAEYYGVLKLLAWSQPEAFYGDHDDAMRDLYNCFDVNVTTTQGEGMGLTTMEAMACGVPCIVPDWSALGDWARGAAMTVPCTATALQNPGLAVVGGVVDEKQFIAALDLLYRDKERRAEVARLGLQRVQQPQFRWENISKRWIETLDGLFARPEEAPVEIWQELNPARQQEGPTGSRTGRTEGQGESPEPAEKPFLAGPDRSLAGLAGQPPGPEPAGVGTLGEAGREAAR